MPSKIEWTNETWPVVTGCTPVSEGCRNCYAAGMAVTRLRNHPRYKGLATFHNGKAKWTGEVRLNHDVLEQPLRWRKPRMIFVASMGDLFHSDVSFMFVSSVWRIMASHQRHTFQILTKRPKRMLEFLNTCWRDWTYTPKVAPVDYCNKVTLPNVWLGTSIENQEQFDSRWYWTNQISAAVLFVSCEPLLGSVKFNAREWKRLPDWVICGGESGPGARPMHPDWARSLRDQCQAAGTPYFFKQHGAWLHSTQLVSATASLGNNPSTYNWPDASTSYRVGKKRTGHLLDGRTWQEFPVQSTGAD